MTFAEYYTSVALGVFPEGEAENLIVPHKRAVIDALIDIQTKVLCARGGHSEFIQQDATLFHLGASKFDTVDGNIERVYTIDISEAEPQVDYTYVDYPRMMDMLRQYKCCRCSDTFESPYTGGPYNIPEYPFGSSANDKGYRTSTGLGYWSLYRGEIYVFPSIESSEQIVVEWNGIQRTFEDDTVVPETLTERDVISAVELYLEAEVERRETKDMAASKAARSLYNDAIAQMIHDCRASTNIIRQPAGLAPDACA